MFNVYLHFPENLNHCGFFMGKKKSITSDDSDLFFHFLFCMMAIKTDMNTLNDNESLNKKISRSICCCWDENTDWETHVYG